MLPLGTDEIRNYQQAGMIAYLNDSDFARLGNVAIWKTRQTEYGRELVARPSDGATSYGAAAIGRSAPPMLRMQPWPMATGRIDPSWVSRTP